MTANNAPTPEPPSLAFDIGPMAAAAKTIRDTRDPLLNYVTVVRAISLGEQPIVVDGHEARRYDVLEKKPQLKSALWNAIRRTDDVVSSMSLLHSWAAGGAVQAVGIINPALETVRSILNAVPAGGTVPAAELPRIREQMQMVTVYSWMARSGMNSITSGLHNFLSGIHVDHDIFATGPLELNRVKDEVGRQVSEAAMPYKLNPITAGIGEAMLQVGRTLLSAIDRLSQNLGNALAGHEAMQGAASALATASTTAWTKYDAASTAVYAADSTTMSVTLRKLQLTTAIESWKQFAKFFSESNL